jgi:hypothetical protein
MKRQIYLQMQGMLFACAFLIGTTGSAMCQVDTSSYPRSYPAPSMLDTLGQVQQLQIQKQQIEMQQMRIEQQRLQMQQAEERQQEFERQQAELYRQKQALQRTVQTEKPLKPPPGRPAARGHAPLTLHPISY